MALARPTSGPMIETHDLRRTFKSRKSRGRSRPRRRPQRRRRRDLRLPRPERGRQDDDPADARDAPDARPSGEATVAGADLRREPQLVRERIGYVPQGGSTDPAETGRGELVLQGRLYGMNKADGPGARRGGAGRARPRGGRRSHDEHLFGRDEAPARRRARHRPQAGGPVPRRADDRPRPAGPRADVGRDPPPARGRARPSSSPPTTSRRPTRWPTGWRSSTTGRSSPRARPTSSSARSPATS